jgi:3-dehydroquinate synthase
LRERPYTVHIGTQLLDKVGEIGCGALSQPAKRAFLIADTGVPASARNLVADSLTEQGLATSRANVTPSEGVKTVATWQRLLTELAQSRHERSDPIIALGGGIVGDLAGFAAAAYRRGVPAIQCPTTLLAMVDASVGGKTGVNLDLAGEGLQKNMVGAFWQPAAVIADISVLSSLPARELRAGFAECLKHALIGQAVGDPGLLEWTRTNLAKSLTLNPQVLVELVGRNVKAKAGIVCQDEREEATDAEGGRALLNLGHTYAHAMETLEGLSLLGSPCSLLHGEAVGLGLIAAAACSEALGLAPAGLASDVKSMVAEAGLPTAVQGLPTNDALLGRMSHDKKARGGSPRLVLPTGDGDARVVADPPTSAVVAGWSSIRA